MLSKKAEQFLTDLKVYLITSGKSEKEIQEIVNELEDHLAEAEKRGKNIDQITGGSPKAFMEQIGREMPAARKEMRNFLLLVFLWVTALIIFPDAIRGHASYSLLEIVGSTIGYAVGLGLLIVYLRLDSSRSLPGTARIALKGAAAFVPFGIFLGVRLAERWMEPGPVFVATPAQSYVLAAACALFFVGYAVVAKTWAAVVFPALMVVPDLAADALTASPADRALLSSVILFAAFALYVAYMASRKRKKT